jgi:hypothetical protein
MVMRKEEFKEEKKQMPVFEKKKVAQSLLVIN